MPSLYGEMIWVADKVRGFLVFYLIMEIEILNNDIFFDFEIIRMRTQEGDM